MSKVIIEISARTFALPFECVCCGASPDTELAVALRAGERPLSPETAHKLDVPYCRRCVEHVASWEAASLTSASILVLAIVGAVVLGIARSPIAGLVVLLAAIPIVGLVRSARRARAAAARGESCATTTKAVTYLGWSGNTTALSFDSPTYTARFAEQNTPILANVGPELRGLLEAHRIARLQVPTPAAAIRTVPDPLTAPEWIAQIASLTGRVARRNALSRALDAVKDPGERKAVIEAACRTELAALFTRADRLATETARRELQQALTEIRADNLPAELREAEVRAVEARLAKVG